MVIRELSTFLNLTLEVSFLVLQVLETQVGLIHFVASIGGGLLVGTCGTIGCSVERFEAGEEGAGAYAEGGVVLVVWCVSDELSEVVEGVVRTGWESVQVVGHWDWTESRRASDSRVERGQCPARTDGRVGAGQ